MSSVRRETGRDLLALALPFVACVIQWWLWPVFQPLVWFLLYPAIFLSAWLGRPPVSIAATLLASGLGIVVFMPPQFAFGGKSPNALFSAVVFVGMGLMFTWTHTRLRDAVRQTVGALREVELSNERLRIANADVTRLYEKTRELDRLKTQFFAHVSHELRTPLTLILGPVAKRLAADELDDESRHDLEVISRNARLLLRHVNDLLDVARLEAGRLELHYARVDVSKLVRFIASHFDVLADEQRICHSVVVPGELPAELDVPRYERILLNLLSNAFKFTPAGGTITTTLTSTPEQVILTIDDSGTGVPEQQRAVIFESFRQLDGGDTRRHEGTGLGLAIVRQFTLQHGGTVCVEASPEGGARFVVTLPRLAPAGVSVDVAGDHAVDVGAAQQAAAELRVPDEVDAFPALTPATTSAAPLVLVVEDHPDMRQYVVGILKGAYRVATARNGAEGLQAAVTLRPDVIVSDVMMPDMSGDQMARELRRRPEFDELPILLLTAKVDERLRAEMLRAGVQDYIAKPFEPDHLLARIEMLLSDAKRRRESLWATLSRLNSHVDNSPLAVVEFTPDFRITRWAGGAERMFGWRSDEVVGKRMNELRWVHEDDLDEVSALRSDLLAGTTTRAVHANRRYRRDGSLVNCEWHNSALLNAAGALDSILALALDVSDRVRAEQTMAQLYEQAREDVQAKSRLLREVNHRVKNNLLALLGLFMVEKRLVPASQAADVGAFIDRFSGRLRSLIRAHETLSRSDWGAMSLSELTSHVLSEALSQVPTGRTAHVAVGPSDFLVSPRQVGSLALVLNELVTNTIKYGANDRPESHIRVEISSTARECTLVYRDDGAGYPERVLSGDRPSIGLVLVSELIEGTLRGRLSLANDRGAVTTLHFLREETENT